MLGHHPLELWEIGWGFLCSHSNIGKVLKVHGTLQLSECVPDKLLSRFGTCFSEVLKCYHIFWWYFASQRPFSRKVIMNKLSQLHPTQNLTHVWFTIPELPRTFVLTVSWKMITAGVRSPTPLLHRLAALSNSSEKCFV